VWNCSQCVRKQRLRLSPDNTRVITRVFVPIVAERRQRIIERVLRLPQNEVHELLDAVMASYSHRHKDIGRILHASYDQVKGYIPDAAWLTPEQKLLLGSYFTMEYAVESAALFNPSIVEDPDQTGVEDGALRVILSLRATGEGHVSSIEFRHAVVKADGEMVMEPPHRFVATPEYIKNAEYDKNLFGLKFIEVNMPSEASRPDLQPLLRENAALSAVLDRLGDPFTFEQLQAAMMSVVQECEFDEREFDHVCEQLVWLARSNYEIRFGDETEISERVIFPVSETEICGIEDARFVRFEDQGAVTYYATYTAYDGTRTLSQLLETRDFKTFRVATLNGLYSQSKGMALFPRKVNGQYAMISRIDGENLYMMYSDRVHFWYEATMLRQPEQPWEFYQIGNCGSPIETEEGWLLLTHGVGPMRTYSVGVLLLDLDDPTKVIARSKQPIIVAEEDEREGYVPNVVYSCGAIVHNGQLVIPYACSDFATSVATLSLTDLLDALRANRA
jgi:predicted GH43/DUF377 family glycosyl hydrolase